MTSPARRAQDGARAFTRSLDSDVEVDDVPVLGRPRPVHLRPGLVLVVIAGGILGTAAREGLTLWVPDVAGLPAAILLVNLLGAFVLGMLLEVLVRRGRDDGARRVLRLAGGTGFCGGFTTYSTLAVGIVTLLDHGSTGTAVVYGIGTVVVGAAATIAGIAAGQRLSGAVGAEQMR